jgi:hypothetical protein
MLKFLRVGGVLAFVGILLMPHDARADTYYGFDITAAGVVGSNSDPISINGTFIWDATTLDLYGGSIVQVSGPPDGAIAKFW